MPAPYPLLFSPLRLGRLWLRNRAVLSAMTTGFGFQEGAPDQRLLAYFQARSQGVGMAVVAFGAVLPEGRVEAQIPWLWQPDAGEVLKPLAASIHEAGSLACLQLGHGGRQSSPRVIGTAPVAPSAVPPAVHVETPPRALDQAGVEAVVAAFAVAASRAAEAGFDAVEVHAGHGYLIQQFLAAQSNLRTDRWGLDRPLFGVEVIRSIRRAAPGLEVIVRINGSDLVPLGLGAPEAAEAARRFADAGAAAILVSAGVYGSVPYTIPLLDDPDGCFLGLGREVRLALGGEVPVIAVGRITTPSLAEAALARSDCDGVALGRALLADPQWIEKAARGEEARIRPCVATVQGCAGMLQFGGEVSCQVNPDVGRERRPAPGRSRRGGTVCVVGGGPAGMEAALRADSRGFRVTLLETTDRLGGALLLAATTPPLASFGRLANWYAARVKESGIEVRFGAGGVGPDGFEHVFDATGARTDPPQLDGYEHLPAWELEDLGEVTCARPVVVGGASWAMAAALRLAQAGRAPAIVSERWGEDTSGLARRAFLSRLEAAGVMVVRGGVERLDSRGAILRDGGRVDCDGVVLAGRRVPARSEGLPANAIRIGDAREPRGLGAAIAEARDSVDRLE